MAINEYSDARLCFEYYSALEARVQALAWVAALYYKQRLRELHAELLRRGLEV